MYRASCNYIANLEHFLDDNGELVTRPVEAAEAGRFLADVCLAGSAHELGEPVPSALRCPVSRGGGKCRGRIEISHVAERDSFSWRCPRCEVHGEVSDWRGSEFDSDTLSVDFDDDSMGVVATLPLRVLDGLLSEDLPAHARCVLLRSLVETESRAGLEVRSSRELILCMVELTGEMATMRAGGIEAVEAFARQIGFPMESLSGALVPGIRMGVGDRPGASRSVSSTALLPPTDVRGAVRGLLDDPPDSPGEMERRLAPFNENDLRRELLRLLEVEPAVHEISGMLGAAFRVAGTTKSGQELERLAFDSGRTSQVRARALVVLQELAPESGQRVMESMSSEQRMMAMAESLRSLFSMMEEEPAVAEQLRELMVAAHGAGDVSALDMIERVRLDEGVPAAIAYRPLLESSSTQLMRIAVETIAKEGELSRAFIESLLAGNGLAGSGLSQDQLSGNMNALQRQALQKMLERVTVDRGETPAGEALLFAPDGTSAVIMMLRQPRPDGGDRLLNAVVRLEGEVRDGFLITRLRDGQWDEMVEEYRAAAPPFTSAPVATVVRIFQDVLRRSQERGLAVPKSVLHVAYRLDRIATPPLPDLPASGRMPSDQELALLLERPEFDSWFYSPGDLSEAGVDPEWFAKGEIDRVCAAIEASPHRHRLISMTEYMARYYSFEGDSKRAGWLARLATGLRRDFMGSPLMLATVFKTITPRSEPERNDNTLAHPAYRNAMRMSHFSDVVVPTGRDLARLDMMEAAAFTIREGLPFMPTSEQPSEPKVLALADLAARHFVDRKGKGHTKKLASSYREVGGFSKGTAFELASGTLRGLEGFVEAVCTDCFVRCWDHPDVEMTEDFFSDEHPAIEFEDEFDDGLDDVLGPDRGHIPDSHFGGGPMTDSELSGGLGDPFADAASDGAAIQPSGAEKPRDPRKEKKSRKQARKSRKRNRRK